MEYRFVDDPDEARFKKDAGIVCTNAKETQEVIDTLDNRIAEQKEHCADVVHTLSRCQNEIDRNALISRLHKHRLLYANYQLRKAVILEKLADLNEGRNHKNHTNQENLVGTSSSTQFSHEDQGIHQAHHTGYSTTQYSSELEEKNRAFEIHEGIEKNPGTHETHISDHPSESLVEIGSGETHQDDEIPRLNTEEHQETYETHNIIEVETLGQQEKFQPTETHQEVHHVDEHLDHVAHSSSEILEELIDSHNKYYTDQISHHEHQYEEIPQEKELIEVHHVEEHRDHEAHGSSETLEGLINSHNKYYTDQISYHEHQYEEIPQEKAPIEEIPIKKADDVLHPAHEIVSTHSEDPTSTNQSHETHEEFVEKMIQDTRRMATAYGTLPEVEDDDETLVDTLSRKKGEDENTLIEEEGSIETKLVTYGNVVEETVIVDRKIIKKTKRTLDIVDTEVTGFRHTSHTKNGAENSHREHTESFSSSISEEISDTCSEDTVKEVHILTKTRNHEDPSLSIHEKDEFKREYVEESAFERAEGTPTPEEEVQDFRIIHEDHIWHEEEQPDLYDDYHHDIEHTPHEDELHEVENAVDLLVEEATVSAIEVVASGKEDHHHHHGYHHHEHDHYYDEVTKILDQEEEPITYEEWEEAVGEEETVSGEENATYEEWEETVVLEKQDDHWAHYQHNNTSEVHSKDKKVLSLRITPISEELIQLDEEPRQPTPTTPVPEVIVTPCGENINYFERDEIPGEFLNNETAEELDHASIEVQTSSTVEDIDEDQASGSQIETDEGEETLEMIEIGQGAEVESDLVQEVQERIAELESDETLDSASKYFFLQRLQKFFEDTLESKEVGQGEVVTESDLEQEAYGRIERLESEETLGKGAELEEITEDGFVFIEQEEAHSSPELIQTDQEEHKENIIRFEHVTNEATEHELYTRHDIDAEVIHGLKSTRYHDSNLNIGNVRDKVKLFEEIIEVKHVEAEVDDVHFHPKYEELHHKRSSLDIGVHHERHEEKHYEEELAKTHFHVSGAIDGAKLYQDSHNKHHETVIDNFQHHPSYSRTHEQSNASNTQEPHQVIAIETRSSIYDYPVVHHKHETSSTSIGSIREKVEFFEELIEEKHHEAVIDDVHYHPDYSELHHRKSSIDAETHDSHSHQKQLHEKVFHHYDEPAKPPTGLQFVRQRSIDVPSSPVKQHIHPENEIGWKRVNLEIDNLTRESIVHHEPSKKSPQSSSKSLDFESHIDANLPPKPLEHPILRGAVLHTHEEPDEPAPVPRRVFMEMDNYARHSLNEEDATEVFHTHSSKHDEEKVQKIHEEKHYKHSEDKLKDAEKLFDMNRYEGVEEVARPPRRIFMEMDNLVRQQSVTEPQSPLPSYDHAIKFPRQKVDSVKQEHEPQPPPYVIEDKISTSKREQHEIHTLTKSKELEVQENQLEAPNLHPPKIPKRQSLQLDETERLFDMNRYEEILELEGKTIKKIGPEEKKLFYPRSEVSSGIKSDVNKSSGVTSPVSRYEPVQAKVYTRPPTTPVEIKSFKTSSPGTPETRVLDQQAQLHEPVKSKFYTIPQTTPVEVKSFKTYPSPGTPETRVLVQPQNITDLPRHQEPVKETIRLTQRNSTSPAHSSEPKISPNRKLLFDENTTDEPELFKVKAFKKARQEIDEVVHIKKVSKDHTERPDRLPLYQEPEILTYTNRSSTVSENLKQTPVKTVYVEKSEEMDLTPVGDGTFRIKSSAPTAPIEEPAYPVGPVKTPMPVPYRASTESTSTPTTIYRTMKSGETTFKQDFYDQHRQEERTEHEQKPTTTNYKEPWVLPSPREIRYKSSENINTYTIPSTASTPGEIGFKHSLSKSTDQISTESNPASQRVDTEAILISKAIAKAATVKRIEIQRKVFETPPAVSTPPPTPLPDAFIETDKGLMAKKMSRKLFKDLEKSMAQEYKKQQEEEKVSYSRRETMESHASTPTVDVYREFDRIPEESGREKLYIELPKRVPYQAELDQKERDRSPSPGLWDPYLVKKETKSEVLVPEKVSIMHTKQPEHHSTHSDQEHLGVSASDDHKHKPIQSPTFHRLEQQIERQEQNQVFLGAREFQPPPKVHEPSPEHLPSILKPRDELKPHPRTRTLPRQVPEPVKEDEDFRNSPAFKKILEAAEKKKYTELELEKENLKKVEEVKEKENLKKVEVVVQETQHFGHQEESQLHKVVEALQTVEPKPRKVNEKPPPPRSPKFNQRFVNPPVIQTSNHYSIMPELEDGLIKMESAEANGFLNKEESPACQNWDPTPLLEDLYKIDYEPRVEQKRNRFKNMEGHLEIPNDSSNLIPEIEKTWKKQYFRTREGRLQWYATHYADEHPEGDILLSGAEIDANKHECIIVIHGGKEQVKIVVRTPSNLFDKWRQALLSHAASSILDAYVQPAYPPVPHYTEKVAIIELGSSAIRGGLLTKQPSLPQVFFPAIGCITDNGDVYVGLDALKPKIRHYGALVRPIEAVESSVERYRLNKEILKASIEKVVHDLKINPSEYKVLLSIPQNIPAVFIGELLKILLEEVNFKAASIARQPSLILYSYDVTTGIVVDIGERLNIVPVIDEYIVENAIVSLPFGAQQIRDSLRQKLQDRNNGLISFKSPVEHIILRNIVEQACYVATDYEEESQKGAHSVDKVVPLDGFNLTPGMENKFVVDSSRFHSTEGLFKPKRWGLEIKGLHQLINDAVQLSPIDSRRTLYRHIYLSGGTSLLHGLAERIENELAKLVPGSIHVQVHMSPWRYHAAYLGAQIIASSNQFDKCCADKTNIDEYIRQLETTIY